METERCPFNGVDCEYIPMAQKVSQQAEEIERLRKDANKARTALNLILNHPVEETEEWQTAVEEMKAVASEALGRME